MSYTIGLIVGFAAGWFTGRREMVNAAKYELGKFNERMRNNPPRPGDEQPTR